MSLVLMDTNILLRGAQPSHLQHKEALDAQAQLRRQGDEPCIVTQNLIEFRAVATRPLSANGLGMIQAEADAEIVRLKRFYPLFPDTPAILSEWERLVSTYGSEGKQNHDARLVAVMLVHSIPAILTFNESDFNRYPEITILTPKDVLPPIPGTT